MGFFLALIGLSALCFLTSLLFSLPLSRAFHGYRAYGLGQLRPDGEGPARAGARRALWRGLRWWVLLWVVAAVLLVWWLYPEYHGSGVTRDVGASGRLANACARMLFFYWPLPYMLGACLLLTPRCRRWRSLFLWTHLGGWAACVLAVVVLWIGLGTVLRFMYFELPSGGYNPGYPDFSALLVYTPLLGVALAAASWVRFSGWKVVAQ